MVIEILKQKYKVGCGRGAGNIFIDNLQDILNYTVDFDFCLFPPKECGKKKVTVPKVDIEGKETGETLGEEEFTVYEEDREFLGHEPKLEPGTCFKLKGKTLALESDRELVLIAPINGGRHVLERLWEEDIEPEYKLLSGHYPEVKFSWEDLDSYDTQVFSEECLVPYPIYKVWKDYFVTGRDLKKIADNKLAVKMTILNLIYPIELIFSDWSVYYKADDFDETEKDEIQEYVCSIISWFCNNMPRLQSSLGSFPDEERQTELYLQRRRVEQKMELKKNQPLEEEDTN